MRLHPAVALAASLLATLACKGQARESRASADKPAEPIRFEDASIMDVIPLADGGAYAMDAGSGLWYVRGGEAVRVREVSSLSAATASVKTQAGWRLALLTRERAKREKLQEARDDEETDAGDDYRDQ